MLSRWTFQQRRFVYTFLILFILYIWRYFNKKSQLIYAKTKTNLNILKQCPTILKQVFSPTIYLQHAILQSMFATLLPPSNPKLKYKYEEILMPTGGHTSLAWPLYNKQSPDPQKIKVLVVVFPGITGSANDNYIKDLVVSLCKAGYKCVVYQGRLNGSKLILPDEGFVDIIKDMKATLEYLIKKDETVKFFGIGHSYGANLLLNYLGLFNKETDFIGGISLANPFNFILGESKARKSLVNSAIADCLQKAVHRSKKELAEAIRFGLNLEELTSYKTVRAFDDNFTRKIYGFETVDEYYWEFSSCRRFRSVRVPLFMLQARDDPIAEANAFIKEDIERHNENIIVMMTPRGGHQGWIEGLLSLKRWYIKPTLEFLDAVIKTQDIY